MYWLLRFAILVIVFNGVSLNPLYSAGGRISEIESAHAANLKRCGPHSLAVCLTYLGHKAPLVKIDEMMPPKGTESSMLDLKNLAEELGVHTRAVSFSQSNFFFPFPAVVKTVQRNGDEHFISILADMHNELLIGDYPHDPYWVRRDVFIEKFSWDGNALLLSTSDLTYAPIWLSQLPSWTILSGAVLCLLVAVEMVKRYRKTATLASILSLASFQGCNSGADLQPVVILPELLEIQYEDSDEDKRQIVATIHNNTNQVMQVSDAKTSCGCTNARFSSKQVLPNKSCDLILEADVPQHGNKDVDLIVSTNLGTVAKVIHLKGEKIAHLPHIVGPQMTLLDVSKGPRTLFVKTIEKSGTPKWLSTLKPTKPDAVEVSLVGTKEMQIDESTVDRTYEFVVSIGNSPGPCILEPEANGKIEVLALPIASVTYKESAQFPKEILFEISEEQKHSVQSLRVADANCTATISNSSSSDWKERFKVTRNANNLEVALENPLKLQDGMPKNVAVLTLSRDNKQLTQIPVIVLMRNSK